MSAGALAFMAITWAGVLGLVGFCFARILRGSPGRRDGDRTRR